jgi:TolB-like protein/Flp pilus assembly protein TadD
MVCLLRVEIGGEDEVAEDSTVKAFKGAEHLGVYEIDRHEDGSLYELGHGAMGTTYRATDTTLQRKVALKIIRLGVAGPSHEARERFLREARAAATLRHENIATVFQFGIREETGQLFYAMELIEGETLDERVRRAGPLDVRTTIGIAQQVTAALIAAEKRGVIHRDLKPANLMLVDAEEVVETDRRAVSPRRPQRTAPTVKIIDFGLAKALNTPADPTHLTHHGFVGTPAFASPEQFEDSALDVRSDIYSLGVTLWFALTGKKPFTGHNVEEIHRVQKSNALPLEQLKAAHAPHCLRSLLKSMLAIEPAARPGTQELAAQLQRCSDEVSGVRRKRVAFAAAAILILGAFAFLVYESWKTGHRPVATALTPSIPEKSVAVLPFENLSRDPDNAYLAGGIQEEILTRLAKIADLKVISRTSTQQYQSKPANLSEIAKQLGVANILEGSVQKAADQVRVNVQLINAQTDSHLWAETYDRTLTDIFGVESEIAKGIAESLQAKLTGREEQALAVKPTSNPEAYDAYLRGLAYEARSASDGRLNAAEFYEKAVELDPNFAIAWARLSRAHGMIFVGIEPTAARRDAAKRALENTQKLAPNSPETLLALGYYEYQVLRDYAAAKTTFGRLRKMLSGSSQVPFVLGLVNRREAHWDESIALFEEALALDPRNSEVLGEVAWTYVMFRQFPAALKLYDQMQDIRPNDPDVMAYKAGIFQAQGDLAAAAKLLAEVNAQTDSEYAFAVKMTQLRLTRNYSDALQLLQARLTQFHSASETFKLNRQLELALIHRLAGDVADAKMAAEQLRITTETLFQDPSARSLSYLSQAYAAMGKKDLALEAAERAVTIMRHAKDAVIGGVYEENLAFIQTIFGENSRAISTLTELLQTPHGSWFYDHVPITPALLRLDPIWDPLRADPAFQNLSEEKIDKSVAVLPFENLTHDPDNAYLAEGLQEEILTQLAKIADLKVISRTSTQRYQSKPASLSEIAKQLGVANILEGSVQKAADQVRVNVQLINAQTDSHLWADTYDRKMTDFFGVESEIAKGIAESLQAKLTGREEQALAVKPTTNPEAYDAYLRGLAFEARSSSSEVAEAAGFYERAVELDPNFALCWARLSRLDALLYFTRNDIYADRRDAAKRALENAQKLGPNSPEILLALGYYQFWVLRDYGPAKTTFGRVSKMLPGSSETPMALALIARREGRWDECIAHYEQALGLDPRNVLLLLRAAVPYAELRQFPVAVKLNDRALDITPNDPNVMANKADIYQAQGNLPQAAKLLREINVQTSSGGALETKINQLRLERNYDEAVRLLQARLAQFYYDSDYNRGDDQVALALMQRLAGDTAAARVTAEKARNTLEQLSRDQPDVAFIAASLSRAYAMMGQKHSALKLAERAIMLVPRAKDPVSGPTYEENLAFIQTMFGETGRALSTLTQLSQTPYLSQVYHTPVTPALLRLDPIWDPLRADPAFQKLCQEK